MSVGTVTVQVDKATVDFATKVGQFIAAAKKVVKDNPGNVLADIVGLLGPAVSDLVPAVQELSAVEAELVDQSNIPATIATAGVVGSILYAEIVTPAS